MVERSNIDMQNRLKRLLAVKGALDNVKGREQKEVEAFRELYERLLRDFKRRYPEVELFEEGKARKEDVTQNNKGKIPDSEAKEKFGIFFYLYGCNYSTSFSEHKYELVFKGLVKQTHNAPTLDESNNVIDYLNSCFFHEVSKAFRKFQLSGRLLVDLYEDGILVGKNIELQVFTDWDLSGKADDISFGTAELDGFSPYYGTYILRKIGKEMLELWNTTMMGVNAIPESCRIPIEGRTSNKVFGLQVKQSNSCGILVRGGSMPRSHRKIPVVVNREVKGNKGIDQLDEILKQGIVYRKNGQTREVWDYRDDTYYTIVDYEGKGPYTYGYLYILICT